MVKFKRGQTVELANGDGDGVTANVNRSTSQFVWVETKAGSKFKLDAKTGKGEGGWRLKGTDASPAKAKEPGASVVSLDEDTAWDVYTGRLMAHCGGSLKGALQRLNIGLGQIEQVFIDNKRSVS